MSVQSLRQERKTYFLILAQILPGPVFAVTVEVETGETLGLRGHVTSPHLSQDDDLRVFTCAPPLPLCEADHDASPSARCCGFPGRHQGSSLDFIQLLFTIVTIITLMIEVYKKKETYIDMKM